MVARLFHLAVHKKGGNPQGLHLLKAENLILRSVQRDTFKKEVDCLQRGASLPEDSCIKLLNPFLDSQGVLRVGGRLNRSEFSDCIKNPVIIPKGHLATFLVRYAHSKVQHQGRALTEGALRKGFWLVNARRLVSSVIYKCVTCKRLRASCQSQLMSELPPDRTQIDPPFTHIGISIRSNGSTNFVGATKELDCVFKFAKDPSVNSYLSSEKVTWLFSVPHASHMGCVWERMIDLYRKILDAMFLNCKYLTHDVWVTLMAEVTAIVNSRPLVPITTDSDNPQLLTPASILTQKATEWQEIMYPVPEGFYRALWKQTQTLANQFWRRWKAEYLAQLQSRRKWKDSKPNIQVGDIALLKNKSLPRFKWPLARVVETLPSPDGLVRKVKLRVCQNGNVSVLHRPICDIVLLLNV
nr:PREDICTED: uncharacterized protein LOC107982700 [Anolis carolinensis]|eukprot:XP_016848197.1 PREDICTED: uncharacterized protein LOC107982700 [Anolis carolinensis]